jgi:hypothetical protein
VGPVRDGARDHHTAHLCPQHGGYLRGEADQAEHPGADAHTDKYTQRNTHTDKYTQRNTHAITDNESFTDADTDSDIITDINTDIDINRNADAYINSDA